MSILAHLNKSAIQRFWKYANKGDKNECWEWGAFTNQSGYGILRLGSKIDKTAYNDRAHRISWTIHFGEIPEGLFVCHHCDNPACVNPAHLFTGTNYDNVQDMMRKGRFSHGETHQNAKLTNNDVREIKRLLKTDIMQADIALRFNISRVTITNIKQGTRWGHIK